MLRLANVLEIRRILFPVDFSDQTYATAPFVEAMASRFDAEVVLLNVAPMPTRPCGEEADGFVAIDPEAFKQDLEPRLDGAFRKEFAHLQVERVMELGEPADVIASFAETQGVDLIMMPTHGDGPLRRLLLGSITAKVVHDVQCAVWTGVHNDELLPAEDTVWGTVLCAVDRTPESTPVMEWASQFAEQVGAALRFIHVVPSVNGYGKQSNPKAQTAMQGEALRAIENLRCKLGVNAPTSVVTRQIAQGVCEEALIRQADLLVIGRGMVRETPGRLGKHAYEIMRFSPCPVISV